MHRDSEDSQEKQAEPLPYYIVEAHGPEPEAPGRGDWKLLFIAGGAFLIVSFGMGVGLRDQRAVIIPLAASGVCILYGFWKLARLKDRKRIEEEMLGFLSIFLFIPLHAKFLFMPLLLILTIKRDTTREEAKGKFAFGAGVGCVVVFVLCLLMLVLSMAYL